MKINYMSDLHTEFDRPLLVGGDGELIVKNEVGADVLVLAGDIVVKNKVEWIENTAKYYKDVVYIMGNHEYYRGRYPETYLDTQARFKGTNVHVLERGSVNIGGVMFHGATLWTDGNHNPITIMRIDRELNDFRLIRASGGVDRFTANYSTILHRQAVDWLRETVKPGDVVLTHHAPSYQSLHPRYAGDSELNAAYMSNLESLIDEILPQVWFHGHVHTSFDYMVGDTRVLCNPRGYHRYEENPKFNVNAVYEVE